MNRKQIEAAIRTQSSDAAFFTKRIYQIRDDVRRETNKREHMEKEIRFLKRLTAGLVFVSGGLLVVVLKNKGEIMEIRKTMNEG